LVICLRTGSKRRSRRGRCDRDRRSGALCVGHSRGRPHPPRASQRSEARWDKEGDVVDSGTRGKPRAFEDLASHFTFPASSSVESTLGAVERAFLSRERTQGGPIGAPCLTHGAPGRSVLSSPNYRVGVSCCGSTQHADTGWRQGCSGRTGWGKSTEASGRRGGGRKRDRKARGPWPGKARLAAPPRARQSDQRWHAPHKSRSLDGPEACSRIISIAEVDRRHAAREPRRIAKGCRT